MSESLRLSHDVSWIIVLKEERLHVFTVKCPLCLDSARNREMTRVGNQYLSSSMLLPWPSLCRLTEGEQLTRNAHDNSLDTWFGALIDSIFAFSISPTDKHPV